MIKLRKKAFDDYLKNVYAKNYDTILRVDLCDCFLILLNLK